MFQGFSDRTIDFMWGIRLNNNRGWFEQHREEYKAVLEQPMKELGADVFERFASRCKGLDMRLHVSRIYRDARRLHGGGPYKDHLWFTLREFEEEWTDKPVFWFELSPDNWSYGLGYYMAKPLTMAKLRKRIDTSPKPLEKLDRRLSSQDEFILEGEEYAKPKRGEGEPLAHWYNKKNFSLIHEEGLSEELFSPELAERLARGFEYLESFYRYLASLESDGPPSESSR